MPSALKASVFKVSSSLLCLFTASEPTPNRCCSFQLPNAPVSDALHQYWMSTSASPRFIRDSCGWMTDTFFEYTISLHNNNNDAFCSFSARLTELKSSIFYLFILFMMSYSFASCVNTTHLCVILCKTIVFKLERCVISSLQNKGKLHLT